MFDPTHPIKPSTDHCFGNLISLSYNKEKKILENHKGLRVTWQGNTEGTKKYSECGVRAIQDLVFEIAG